MAVRSVDNPHVASRILSTADETQRCNSCAVSSCVLSYIKASYINVSYALIVSWCSDVLVLRSHGGQLVLLLALRFADFLSYALLDSNTLMFAIGLCLADPRAGC